MRPYFHIILSLTAVFNIQLPAQINFGDTRPINVNYLHGDINDMIAGDINNDGYEGLVVLATRELGWYENQDGLDRPRIYHKINSVGNLWGQGKYVSSCIMVKLADFDNDNDQDILIGISDRFTTGITVFENLNGKGNLSTGKNAFDNSNSFARSGDVCWCPANHLENQLASQWYLLYRNACG